MTTLTAYIEGIGMLGPGLAGWPDAQAVLAGHAGYTWQATVLPVATALPSAERRRCGPIVRLALAVGMEAVTAAGRNAALLPAVFSASGADGDNCHALCEMLASEDRQISPTRFHNSVHNAAAGYWSIATGAMTTSSALCAHDASFGAGLLEAVTQVTVDQEDVLLVTCDTAYPEPLRSVRTIPDAFGMALVLSARPGARTVARISVACDSVNSAPVTCIADPALEQLRTAIPAARGLPLLRALARRESTDLVIDYLDACPLSVRVAPC